MVRSHLPSTSGLPSVRFPWYLANAVQRTTLDHLIIVLQVHPLAGSPSCNTQDDGPCAIPTEARTGRWSRGSMRGDRQDDKAHADKCGGRCKRPGGTKDENRQYDEEHHCHPDLLLVLHPYPRRDLPHRSSERVHAERWLSRRAVVHVGRGAGCGPDRDAQL